MESDHICRGRALRIAVEFAALAILLLAGGAGAATLTVCSSGCTYTSIQAAINAASTGDIVEVQSGTYYENVNVNKSLTLKGIDIGGGKPVVDARGNGNAITLSAGNSVLEGFAARNSSVWPNAGIKVNSNNNNIKNNTASNNYDDGISLYSSSNNTLSNNTASNNWDGISLYSSSNNTLSNNTASNNGNGISLYSSSNNTLIGNTMFGNSYNFGLGGNSDSDFDQNIDTSNLVDGKPIYYVKNAANQIYDGSTNAGTFYCISCNNVTIRGLTLSKNFAGVYLWKTQNSRIENILASNNSNVGIWLSDSSNNTLNNNTASNNSFGVGMYSSSNNTLSNNTASNNSYGIYLWDSSNNTLSNNTASNNYYGIYMDYASNNNTLSNNNASNNSYYGIYLYGSSNTLIGNNAANNGNGIFLYSSSSNTLSGNNASNNRNVGIYLSYSSNNAIYNNYFNNTINAQDNGNNFWNITKTAGTNIIGSHWIGGNFWSDYSGKDTDGDGLGDTLLPYNSSGNITNGGDFLPLTITPTPTAGISGYKINDTNGNGKWDAGEKGISNWTIRLIGIIGKGKDTSVIRKDIFTDAMGFYKFDNLQAGRYFVIEKLKKGFVPTNSTVKRIKLAQGENSMNNNFTNMPAHRLDKIDGQRDVDDYEVINRDIDKYKEEMD